MPGKILCGLAAAELTALAHLTLLQNSIKNCNTVNFAEVCLKLLWVTELCWKELCEGVAL